jgi:hypothetical protein
MTGTLGPETSLHRYAVILLEESYALPVRVTESTGKVIVCEVPALTVGAGGRRETAFFWQLHMTTDMHAKNIPADRVFNFIKSS